MNRSSKLGAIAAATASVAVLAGLGAANAAGAGRNRPDETERFTLQQPNDVAQFLDTGAQGSSVGYTVFFHGSLLDRRGARTVGSQRGACEFVEVATGATHCVVTVRFGPSAQNTVEAAGEFFVNADGTVKRVAVFSITGGTGRYQGASGQITITNLSADGAKAREDWILQR